MTDIPRNAVADKRNKQEAMQCIPRSVKLCKQMIIFNKACVGNKTVHPNKKQCNVHFGL